MTAWLHATRNSLWCGFLAALAVMGGATEAAAQNWGPNGQPGQQGQQGQQWSPYPTQPSPCLSWPRPAWCQNQPPQGGYNNGGYNGGYPNQPYQQGYNNNPSKSSRGEHDTGKHSAYFGGLSLHGGQWGERGGVGNDDSFLYMLALDVDGHFADPYASVRAKAKLALGGGGNGFETWTNLLLTGGVRGQVGDTHGPYIRGGIGFDRMKSDRLFWYHLALPVVEAGYQYLDKNLLLEAGFIGGGSLLGQLTTGNTGSRVFDSDGEIDQLDNSSDGPKASRPLGTAGQAGFAVTAQVLGLRASVQAERIFSQTGPRTPVDVASASLCFSPIDGFAACAEGMHFRGDLVRSDNKTIISSSATYLGGLLAFGVVRGE